MPHPSSIERRCLPVSVNDRNRTGSHPPNVRLLESYSASVRGHPQSAYFSCRFVKHTSDREFDAIASGNVMGDGHLAGLGRPVG